MSQRSRSCVPMKPSQLRKLVRAGAAPILPMKPSQLRKLVRAEATAVGVEEITSNVHTLDLDDRSTPMATTVNLGQADPLACYVSSLCHERRWFSLTREYTFALADCDARGGIKDRKFQLVKARKFGSTSGENHVMFLCSCDGAQEQYERLSATASIVVDEDIRQFAVREEELYCLHARAAKHLVHEPLMVEDEGPEDESEEGSVEQLQTDPFLAAVHDGESYGILKRVGKSGRLCCGSCSDRQMSCSHVAHYKEWCRDRDVDPNVVFTASNEPKFESVSTSPVPYPWTPEMKKTFLSYIEHKETFPRNLVPDVPTGVCSHGHAWDNRDPVVQEWVQHVGPTIYTRYANITDYVAPDGKRHPRVVYYRPTVGDCRCRHMYDGLADLLHNIDNRSLVFFGLMVDYLHSMVEGRQPLRTTQRVCNKTRSVCTDFKGIPWETLRQGWNTWARRLAIDWEKEFQCCKCGRHPSTVVCDGTAIGFRRDLLQHQPPAAEHRSDETPVVTGSRHSERVFVRCAKARELLLRYSGSKRRGSSKHSAKSGISPAEMEDLQNKLDRCGREDVTALLRRLVDEGHAARAPQVYSTFLSELARSTPVCGMIQIAGDANAINTLKNVANGTMDLTSSGSHEYLGYLQRKAPVLTDFLCSVTKDGRIPPDVSALTLSLMAVLTQTFDQVPVPSADCYPTPPAPSPLSFFPSLPQLCGLPRYAADESRKPREKDGCRKESYGHPTLTPGLFTVFCEHGVCYGFEAMRSCESPKHPFDILRTRFTKAPGVVIYDNSCQLHRYAMNRDPHFFKNTVFLVDRFHYKGHVGCSLGYCMDSYAAEVNIRSINSQVNEQANSGLIRIQPQLAYMSSSNFVFHASLFLAVRNMGVSGHN